MVDESVIEGSHGERKPRARASVVVRLGRHLWCRRDHDSLRRSLSTLGSAGHRLGRTLGNTALWAIRTAGGCTARTYKRCANHVHETAWGIISFLAYLPVAVSLGMAAWFFYRALDVLSQGGAWETTLGVAVSFFTISLPMVSLALWADRAITSANDSRRYQPDLLPSWYYFWCPRILIPAPLAPRRRGRAQYRAYDPNRRQQSIVIRRVVALMPVGLCVLWVGSTCTLVLATLLSIYYNP